MDRQTAATLAVQRAATRHAPDTRVTPFDVTASTVEEGVALAGVVETDRVRDAVVAAVEATLADHDGPSGVDASDLVVLESRAAVRTVSAPVTAVRAAPDESAERVTEALYGAEVTAFDRRGAWRRVRLPDGYVGWVAADVLVDPVPVDPSSLVVSPRVSTAEGPRYAGTECEVVERVGDEVLVRFRTGETTTLSADAVDAPRTDESEDAVLEAALAYEGTEYVWGGMTVEGIDCSGLVWQAFHRVGVPLPRDADQQRAMGRAVDPEPPSLEPADLLFFPGHVAVSLGGADYVHACGTAGEVTTNSLDPDDERYSHDRAETFDLARRLL